ncbi:23S rRNA (adenine(2030)-N(6))-methyltransferase RlmJ [Phenylobacterium sp. 58.2.17]|uniref:23S rRNA (adenine(2030)-N(6))-methyltransferase RlmJ n=1 Tax=Phenylobacterium sp. 58.2.17 TaxID=2969306 RepID=UPI002264A893|nr:23S rRNA (adenine(2030)-N(6))-methyltransferase RlmJ [Phenylobacterium sp. 58.2.17]MCX7588035.1 23S rRNA (adenine(2030)-N(6))-methyltransferase RlmJ [Phenylobacterium sp. 58.2.17]
MNYRHAFHAGNFADLVKHAALLDLLARLQTAPEPLAVFDTHAGRGLYDLTGEEAQRSGEARAGVAQLMQAPDLPPALQALRQAVVRLNGGAEANLYPGSPLLVAGALRKGDTYLGCELRPQEHSALSDTLASWPAAKTACADGYVEVAARMSRQGAVLVLIDPPFERSDDYERCAAALGALTARNPAAVVMVWMPLKDLETFDAFLREAEDAYDGPLLVAEARMRPLTDPMKMNGCALVLANAPEGFEATLAEVCGWTVGRLGANGKAQVWTT